MTANPSDYLEAAGPDEDVTYASLNHTAPHSALPDAPANFAFTSGVNSHIQYPVAEVKARDIQTTSGGHEGNATVDPSE